MDRQRALRWSAPVAILVPWLAFLTIRQVALFPAAHPPPDPLRLPLVGGSVAAIGAAVVVRWLRPTVVTHVVALAVITCGIALVAAQIGVPLANATSDYCGDFCRTAILGRFVTFFGWPILTAIALGVVARFETAEWASWTRPWAAIALVAGLAAALAWWRIILPNG